MPSQTEIAKGKKLLKYWKDTTGQSVNVIKDHWGFSEMVSIMTIKEIKILVDYFVKLNNGENITWFYNNYDKLEEAIEKQKRDREERRKLMERTEKRVQAWKQN